MSIKAYKGFNKDMTCKGFQFKEGETYHEDEAKMCEKGFHACLDPLDCFSYYKPHESVYHEVELDDVTGEKSKDSKICGKTLKVGAALDIAGIVKTKINLTYKKIKNERSSQGNYSANSSQGYCSANSSQGYYSANVSLGAYSSNEAMGKSSICVGWGRENKCKAIKGSYIVLSEYGEWNGNEYPLICAKMHKVDGKTIKPDTWYTLKGGKFVEVSNDEEKG